MSTGIETRQVAVVSPVESGFRLLDEAPPLGVIAPGLLPPAGETFIPIDDLLTRVDEQRAARTLARRREQDRIDADTFAHEHIIPQAEIMGWCAVLGASGRVENTTSAYNQTQRTITALRRPTEDHPLTTADRRERRALQADARKAHEESADALRTANRLFGIQFVAAHLGEQSFDGYQKQAALAPVAEQAANTLATAIEMRAADRIMLAEHS